MKYKMYSIHDSAVKSFLPPHFMRTHGEAERTFKQNINNPETGHLYNSPEQFTLFYIGEYDDETGFTEQSPEGPQCIMKGIQVKKDMTDDERQMTLRKAN